MATSTPSIFSEAAAMLNRPFIKPELDSTSLRACSHRPSMPAEGHKTHLNTLNVKPESYRTLQIMHTVKPTVFSQNAVKFIHKFVQTSYSEGDTDRVLGESITVPVLCYSVPDKVIPYTDDVDGICQWVLEYPLATVKRLVHLVFPETKLWNLDLHRRDDIDEDLIRHFTWCPKPSLITSVEDTWKPSMTIFVQPPWIVSPKELELFITCGTLRPPRSDHEYPYESHERLWGKIWDVCIRKQSHWFVLTTYWGWVFGAFSEGWSRAFVSEVKRCDTAKPTVLECLFYWFASASGVEGAWTIPEVMLFTALTCFIFVINKLDILPSESDWAASSDVSSASGCDTESNFSDNTEVAETAEVAQMLLSPTGLPLRPSVRKRDLSRVADWQRDTHCGADSPAVKRLKHALPSPSEITITSISTVSAIHSYSDVDDFTGAHVRTNSSEMRDDYV
ncbi:hypothetical protein A0H81_04415 [Grifola frondosa]|uniref:Uncharacterized protein n=1 Tax=Grifola frondosa TaxID=5627 RepID=A0A1C7ML39_GRIFR|nr:hypothetical protein A0H81_04415 [Grifola frondosa]